jgi:hypothetical protein
MNEASPKETAIKEQRQFERRMMFEPTWVVDPTVGDPMECTVRNVSVGGAYIQTPNAQALPDLILLVLRAEDYVMECRVIWRGETALGVEWLEPGGKTLSS